MTVGTNKTGRAPAAKAKTSRTPATQPKTEPRNRAERRGTSTVEELEPDLITIPVAARRIKTHPDTLYRLARSGQFPPALQIGSRWWVSVPRLQRYLHGGEAS